MYRKLSSSNPEEMWLHQKMRNFADKNPNWRGGKEVSCDQCGTLVWRRPSELKKHKHHFCSNRCHDEFRRGPKDPNRLRAKDMRRSKHPRWAGSKHCKICGAELLERDQRRRGTCGSEECHRERVRRGAIKGKISAYGPHAGRTTFTCEYCGREVEATKSIAKKRRFCSNECHIRSGSNLKFTKPTSLEIAVAEALEEMGIRFKQEYSPVGAPGPYDFYVPGMNVLIEADGEFWHHSEWADENFNVVERDEKKTEWAMANQYKFLRVREREVMRLGAELVVRKAFSKLNGQS